MLIKEKAEQDAAEILATYWGDEFPVDPERIARRMGLLVDRRMLRPGTSGILQVDPSSTPRIYVDADDVPQRQSFTIAHELGHFYERTSNGEADFNFIDRRGGKYNVHEFYADEFAANLLMPSRAVHRLKRDGASLARMARHFGVSFPAMTIRLRRLGYSAT